jgi:hypothetical protein
VIGVLWVLGVFGMVRVIRLVWIAHNLSFVAPLMSGATRGAHIARIEVGYELPTQSRKELRGIAGNCELEPWPERAA